MATTRPKYQWLSLGDFRGGQNSTDSPIDLQPNQVVSFRNGDTFRTKLFRKRGGATAPAIGAVFSGIISSLIAHFPDNNPGHAELWGVDDHNPPIVGRMAAATVFTAVTLVDAISSAAGGVAVRGASYNGKLFLAFNSGASASYVWDPNLSVPQVRKVGLLAPNQPSVADTGGGAYAAILRFYRTRELIKHGSVIDAYSEPSSVVQFTPSGGGTAARVTKAAGFGQLSTHWIVEGSADNVTFYKLSGDIVIGTTTYDDTAAPSTYAGGTLSPVLGAFTTFFDFTSAPRYVIAAFNRVFYAGAYGASPASRVWYTPSKGTADKGDDERIPNSLTVRNWVDLGEGIGGDITGFAGPIYGAIYVFKYKQIRQMTPTGASSPVFDVIELSDTRGAIEQECICVGEDATGRSCVYFMDPQVGPMLIGAQAPLPIGDAIRDLWDTVNLSATSKVGQIVDYPAKGQVWFWFATGSSNDPNIRAIYTKATGGWQVDDTGGKTRLARCAVLFPRTPGASMSRDKVPYVGYSQVANTLLRCDTADLDDAGTAYQAVVKTKALTLNKGKKFRVSVPVIVAQAASGVTLTVTLDCDFGKTIQTGTIDLTPIAVEGSATRVWRKVEGIDQAEARDVQLQIGDAAAIANSWTVESVHLPVDRSGHGGEG